MKRQILKTFTVLILGLFILPSTVQAVTTTWTAGDGDWDIAGNWDAGVPATDDNAYLVQNDETDRIVTYKQSAPNPDLAEVRVDATGEGSMTFSQGQDYLRTNDEYIGHSGTGTFIQTGGTNAITNRLYLGYGSGSTGTYNLSGNPGSLLANYGTGYVGYYGVGVFNQSGGRNQISNTLYVSYSSGSGTYNLSGGSLSALSERVSLGGGGTGTFIQTGGTNTSYYLDVGYFSNSNGTYNLNDGSLLSSLYQRIGCDGTGTFNQTGGTNTISSSSYDASTLFIGTNSGGNGSYNLSGTGSLLADYEYVGWRGTGAFTQSGGTHTVSNYLMVGSDPTGIGSYNLSSGILSANLEGIGLQGTGVFIQSGGINTVANTLYVGYYYGSSGSYNLSGTGSLLADYEDIGHEGTGIFTQTGGTNIVNNILSIGDHDHLHLEENEEIINSSSGTYNLLGGTLSAGEVIVSNEINGTFTISGGTLSVDNFSVGTGTGVGELAVTNNSASITIDDTLSFGANSIFSTVPGATIHMTGSAFDNKNTDSSDLAGLGNLELIFEGGLVDLDPFEVAGQDMGAVMAGFENNFVLGALTLGGIDIGQIQLFDSFDNQTGWEGSEALYVYNLNIGADSYLDLNGLNLYYLNGTIDSGANIVFNGGSLTAVVPEPGTLILLGIGLMSLVGYAKRKR